MIIIGNDFTLHDDMILLITLVKNYDESYEEYERVMESTGEDAKVKEKKGDYSRVGDILYNRRRRKNGLPTFLSSSNKLLYLTLSGPQTPPHSAT